jgi:hypothetical protein
VNTHLLQIRPQVLKETCMYETRITPSNCPSRRTCCKTIINHSNVMPMGFNKSSMSVVLPCITLPHYLNSNCSSIIIFFYVLHSVSDLMKTQVPVYNDKNYLPHIVLRLKVRVTAGERIWICPCMPYSTNAVASFVLYPLVHVTVI